jgi:23S rRNA pseudouridine2605 synthase
MARHAFWVIVAGDQPTSFRARERDELLPTLKQLQHTQPETDIRWFERGKLWASQDEAREALLAVRKKPERRGRDWRPGGAHADPRAKYIQTRDQKRAKFKRNLSRQWKDGDQPPSPSSEPTPENDVPAQAPPPPPRAEGNERAPRRDRPEGGAGRPDRPESRDRPPSGDRPFRPKAPSRPWRPEGPPRGDRPPSGDRGPRRDRPEGGERPRGEGRPDRPGRRPPSGGGFRRPDRGDRKPGGPRNRK